MSVLVVAPHQDDEVLGCGGTISKLVQKNIDVDVIIITNKRIESDSSEAVRLKLGYRRLHNLSFTDETVTHKTVDLIKFIENIYTSDTYVDVYIPYKFDYNMDHGAVFDACDVSFRLLQANPPRRVFCYEILSSTNQYSVPIKLPFAPNYYEVLSSHHISKKIEAMTLGYPSQIRPSNHPRSVDGITCLSRLRGMECNSMYAEGFILLRQLEL